VIEVVENRVNLRNVVLSRKAMMTTNSAPAVTATRVEVQVIGTPYSSDDYFTWSPHYCRARIVNAAAVVNPLTIRLRNMPGAVGQVRFATKADLAPTTNTNDASVTDYHTATRTTLDLTLPADGEWRTFYAAGAFGSPSDEDKDAVIEAVSTGGGTMYGRYPVMVRVRKNGNTLENVERDRFLEAVRSLQPRGGVAFDRWLEFIEQHAVGTDEGHTGPGFLPWHRVYMMRLERDLQALDPSVAIPYWRPDQIAPNIFHRDFLGRDGSGNLVTLDANNPLSTWSINTGSSVVTGIQRNANFNNATGMPSNINSEADVFAFGNEYDEVRSPLEGNPHGRAHTQAAGNNGWVGNFFTSPRDPLFFLIHGNVDHVWAKWQIRQRKTMHADFEEGYYTQGTFPGAAGMTGEHKGHYLMDEMWPWNEEMGGGTSGLADRPASSYGVFPQTVGQTLMMPSHPRPYDVIDYRVSKWIQGNTPNFNQGIGFAYDDVPFNTAL
jgi:tyrosinase